MKILMVIIFMSTVSCAPLNISDSQKAQTLIWLADKWSEPREAQEIIVPIARPGCFPVDNGYYVQMICQ